MSSGNSPILLLFDIDGTLVRTNGRAGRLMIRATEELTGHKIPYDIHNFIGRTDRMIIRQFLRQNQTPESGMDELIEKILDRYLKYAGPEMKKPGSVRVIPGVKNLLRKLITRDEFRLGLLTGNLKRGAQAKLGPVGLDAYFPVGAFGDDSEERNRLPKFALQRARRHYGIAFRESQSWIIGDSPRDIECAASNGLHCLAVATGRISRDELASYHPDVVLENLEATETVTQYFLANGGGKGR